MAEFTLPTQDAFDAVTRRTAEAMKRQLLATGARYDRRLRCVMITLNTGAVVGFPLSVLPGLENATPEDLRKIEIEGGGYGLRVACLDADISIPSLLEHELGSTVMKRAVTRANASRTNGLRGGRPRKSVAA